LPFFPPVFSSFQFKGKKFLFPLVPLSAKRPTPFSFAPSAATSVFDLEVDTSLCFLFRPTESALSSFLFQTKKTSPSLSESMRILFSTRQQILTHFWSPPLSLPPPIIKSLSIRYPPFVPPRESRPPSFSLTWPEPSQTSCFPSLPPADKHGALSYHRRVFWGDFSPLFRNKNIIES